MIGPREMLLAAVRVGDAARVRQLVRRDPWLVNAKADTGESAVMVALGRYKLEVVAVLIDAGAELDLHEACAAGQADRVAARLAAGDDVNRPSSQGWMPLHLAAYFGHADLIATLVAAKARVSVVSDNSLRLTPVQYAVTAGQTACVQTLLTLGADGVSPMADGSTPLHEAALLGDARLVDLLLRHNASITALNAQAKTPWQVAQDKRHEHLRPLLAPTHLQP